MRYFFIVSCLLITSYSIALFFENNETIISVIDLIFTDLQNVTLGIVLITGFMFSFLFGLLVGGSAWISSNSKYVELKKANDGLKSKLKKANEDLEYQVKKMSIFEDTIKTEANKKPPPAPKKKAKRTFLGIPLPD